MNCNCNNTTNNTPDVRVVQGNVMRLAIPLTLRTLEKVGDEIQSTDTDFIPSGDVTVELCKNNGLVKKTLDVEMRGNIAIITDKGTLPVGVYSLTILCTDDYGNPYRFKETPIVQIVDKTKEAGITAPAEYEVGTWYLNPAIYLAMKGEDGVGIADITTESSSDIGGMNTITITMTNGQTRTFTVMNGSGSVDDILNINSPHPIANKTVTAKFDELSQGLAQLVGYADYNKDNETIRLYDKQRQTVLASVSGFPFVRNVYISNNTLVVTFSEGSGRSAIGIPLSGIFNPNNYFTRTQVNNIIDGIYADLNGMIGDKASLTSGKVPYGESSAVVLDAINVSVPTNIPAWIIGKVHYCVDGKIRRYVDSGTNYAVAIVSTPDPYLIYFNRADGKFYTWDSTSGMEEIETGSGGGGTGEETDPIFSASPAAGITQAIIDYWNAKQEAIGDLGQIRAGAAAGATALQPGALDGYATSDAVNRAIARIQSSIDELMGADDVTDAIDTFNEIVAFLANVENTDTLAGIIAGLNTAIAAKYTKPSTGIPASDLAQAVRDLLALAGTAVQPSALNGYVTTSTLNGYYTKSEVNGLIPDISGKADKSEMAVEDNGNGTVTITLKSGTSATVLTQHQSLAGYALSSSLAAVATSGSYNDLSNKPTIPAAQVQSDWNAVSGMGVILNKPTNLSEFTNDLETPSVTVSATGDVSQALNPNTFYKFGAVDSLDLTLVAGNGLVVYFGRFSTSANWGGTGLTVPSGVTEGANNPTVEASKTYEFNIMDNVLLLMEV